MTSPPWGATVPESEQGAIELDGLRYPVHRGCIRLFVVSPDEDAEAWHGQRADAALHPLSEALLAEHARTNGLNRHRVLKRYLSAIEAAVRKEERARPDEPSAGGR